VSMRCVRCGCTTGSMLGRQCLFCAREGRLARFMWWFWPDLMLQRRLRQNLRSGGWL
jgi:hypothetical protein